MESKSASAIPAAQSGANCIDQEALDAVKRALTIRQALQNPLQNPSSGGISSLNMSGFAFGQLPNPNHCAEIEINDYPQNARWKVTHKAALDEILENINVEVAVTTRGVYIATGRKPQPGERKLYLLIEGKDGVSVARAKAEIVRVLETAAEDARPEKPKTTKYTVLTLK